MRVTFQGPDTEAQIDTQIDMFATALANKPDAMGFAALDSQAASPVLHLADQAGIPIIAFDSGVDGDIPIATATTDNIAASSLAADKMAALIGEQGEVAVVSHSQTSSTGMDRRDGFVNRIKKAYPNIKIVTIQYGEGDHLKSTEVTRAILTSHPHLAGIFGTNEGAAAGVVNAVREAKANGIVIIGFDSGKAQQDAIRSGLEAGAITQNPIGIGYKTVQAAVDAIHGKKLPKVIDTGFYYYNIENIDDPKIAAVLYN